MPDTQFPNASQKALTFLSRQTAQPVCSEPDSQPGRTEQIL